MSVAGSTRTGVTVDEVAESFMLLPRNTLSAAPGHRHARGLDAVLLAFDRKVQLALRSLCIERLELEARKRAMLERIVSSTAVGGTSRTPEVLVTLNTKILDNDSNIRRLAGSAGAATILDSLKDPEILAGLQLEVPTEEAAAAEGGGDEDAARVWRRKLDTQRAARSDAPFRHTGHDSPSVTGDRDLHNVLASKKEEDGLSYYQRQQLKYGRGRRGSTSVAGEPFEYSEPLLARLAFPHFILISITLFYLYRPTTMRSVALLSFLPIALCCAVLCRRVGWRVGW